MEQENQELLELLRKMLKENEDANKQLKKQLLYSKILHVPAASLRSSWRWFSYGSFRRFW